MKSIYITQAIYLPFLYFGTVILAGGFAVEYSHIGQQVSELALNESWVTKNILGVGIFATGLSMITFGIGLLLEFKKQYTITSALIIIFGVTFLFGAVFAIGSPWHSVYGVVLVYFWSLLAKLHPWDYRGLAQRIFGIAIFGSISRMASVLRKKTVT